MSKNLSAIIGYIYKESFYKEAFKEERQEKSWKTCNTRIYTNKKINKPSPNWASIKIINKTKKKEFFKSVNVLYNFN